MKGTREQIIDLLRRHGEMSVADLSRSLDIAAPAVRRHMDILAAENLVDVRAVRQSTGRPYFAYRLTEQAMESPAAGYVRLLERLLRDAAESPAGEGRQALLDVLLERLSNHLAEDYRGKVRGTTLEEKVASLIDALRDEGILDQWERRPDGIHLYNTACPHRRAALAAHELCNSERRAIAMLLGEDVEQVGRMVDGAGCCEYVVRRPAASALVSIQ